MYIFQKLHKKFCLQTGNFLSFFSCLVDVKNIVMYMQDGGEGAGRGGVVVKAPSYKPAGRGFDSRWCRWNYSVTKSFQSHYDPGVDSASNINEYQVYFLGVKAVGA